MLSRILMVLCAVVLVTACSSKQEEVIVGDQPTLGANGGYDPAGSVNTGVNGANGNGYGTSEVGGYNSQNLGSATPGSSEDFVTNVGDRIYFETNSYTLTGEARRILEAQAAWLQRYPNLNVAVEGHADERGTREYNIALGDRRANSIENYLVAYGLDPRRVRTISFGKERPAVPSTGPSAWSQNRRGITRVQ